MLDEDIPLTVIAPYPTAFSGLMIVSVTNTSLYSMYEVEVLLVEIPMKIL